MNDVFNLSFSVNKIQTSKLEYKFIQLLSGVFIVLSLPLSLCLN